MSAGATRADETKTVRQQLADRLKVAAGIPRVLRLVMAAQPRLAAALIALNVLQGVQPALSLWVIKALIDAAAAAVQHRLTPGGPAATAATSIAVGGADPSPVVEWLGLGDLPGAGAALALLGVAALLAALGNLLEPTSTYVQLQMGDHLSREVQSRILVKANSLVDISYFENPKFYDALQRAQQDAGHRPLNVLAGTTALFRGGVQLLSMLAVLATAGPVFALAAVLLALPNLYLQFASQYDNFTVSRWNILEVRRMRYFSDLMTFKESARELRIFGLTGHFLRRYLEEFQTMHRRVAAIRRDHLWKDLACAAVTSLGFTALYTLFAVQALARRISLGDMTLYSGATLQTHQRILDLVRQLGSLYADVLFVGHLFEFLDTQPAMAVRDDAAPAPPLRRGIEFRDVTFTYPGTDRPVLERFSLTIRPGECVALVGENGAGKTTLVKLLGRLYDPTEGDVYVDGVNLRDVDLDEWRRRIGAIFQDFCHYHLAAKANIGLGSLPRLEDMDAIRRAAARGGATAVVEKLEDGYDTVLGRWLGTGRGEVLREGAELSGGEWQKIALSRGFMRSDGNGAAHEGEPAASAEGDAQLLILDEPTAALDTQSEYDVYLRFRELTKGKATLLISHRFSTVRMADRIVVLEHGRIIEDGTHAELMALGGTYADLYEKQASRYR